MLNTVLGIAVDVKEVHSLVSVPKKFLIKLEQKDRSSG